MLEMRQRVRLILPWPMSRGDYNCPTMKIKVEERTCLVGLMRLPHIARGNRACDLKVPPGGLCHG
jgi:hypothetical protein